MSKCVFSHVSAQMIERPVNITSFFEKFWAMKKPSQEKNVHIIVDISFDDQYSALHKVLVC